MDKQTLENRLQDIIKLNYFDSEEGIALLDKLKEPCILHGEEYYLLRSALLERINKNDLMFFSISKKALNTAYASNNLFVINEATHLVCIFLMGNGEINEAFRIYIRALDIFENFRILNNIGDIFLELEDYNEALKYFNRAMKVFNIVKKPTKYDLSIKTIIIGNIAESYINLNELEKAEDFIDKMDVLSNKIDYSFSKSFVYTLLGEINLKRHEYLEAEENFKWANYIFVNECALDNQNLIKKYINDNNRWLSKAYYLSGKYEDSINTVNRLRNKSTEDYILLIKNYKKLNDKEMLMKEYESFLNYTNMDNKFSLNILSESLKNKTKIMKAEKMANEYESLYTSTKSISEIGKKIISATKLDDVINVLYSHIKSVMDVDSILIGEVNNDTKEINYNWIMEKNVMVEPYKTDIYNRNSFSSWVVRNNEAILINDGLAKEEILKYKEKFISYSQGIDMNSLIICPISIGKNILGVISIQTIEKNKYTMYNLEVIKMFSSFIAIAMENWINIKKLEKVNHKLENLYKTDSLTGINNRYALDESLNKLFNELKKTKSSLSVVIVDIDRFKEYNDTYGHQEGDACIVKIANEINKHLVASGGKLFRYGGDEFLALIPYKSSKEVNIILEELRRDIILMKIKNGNNEKSKYVTCSFGFTTFIVDDDTNYERAFYLADTALYIAKAKGKNKVVFTSSEEILKN